MTSEDFILAGLQSFGRILEEIRHGDISRESLRLCLEVWDEVHTEIPDVRQSEEISYEAEQEKAILRIVKVSLLGLKLQLNKVLAAINNDALSGQFFAECQRFDTLSAQFNKLLKWESPQKPKEPIAALLQQIDALVNEGPQTA